MTDKLFESSLLHLLTLNPSFIFRFGFGFGGLEHVEYDHIEMIAYGVSEQGYVSIGTLHRVCINFNLAVYHSQKVTPNVFVHSIDYFD